MKVSLEVGVIRHGAVKLAVGQLPRREALLMDGKHHAEACSAPVAIAEEHDSDAAVEHLREDGLQAALFPHQSLVTPCAHKEGNAVTVAGRAVAGRMQVELLEADHDGVVRGHVEGVVVQHVHRVL